MPERETYLRVMDSDLGIRQLEPEDLPQVLEIERQGYSNPWNEAVFRDCFQDNYQLWGACHGEHLVGYAVVARMHDEAHLLNLCVAAGEQGQGTGRRLLRHVLAQALKQNLWQVILEVRPSNAAANRLYESEGFVEIGRRPEYYPGMDGREDARVMAFRFER